MAHTGGCLCGAVRYRVAGPGYDPVNCHCRRCRASVGGPFVSWVSFALRDFEYTEGSPVEHESSSGALRMFCGVCGTSLGNRRRDKPGEIVISICSLDQPETTPPRRHLWGGEKLLWVRLGDGLPVNMHE